MSKYLCVRSSANENPAKDFNEWAKHVHNTARKNYFKQIQEARIKFDSIQTEINNETSQRTSHY